MLGREVTTSRLPSGDGGGEKTRIKMAPAEPAFPPAEGGVTAAPARWRRPVCCAGDWGGCLPGFSGTVGPRRRPEASGRVSPAVALGAEQAPGLLRAPLPHRGRERRLRSLYFILSPQKILILLGWRSLILSSHLSFFFFLCSRGGDWRQHDHSKSLPPFPQ